MYMMTFTEGIGTIKFSFAAAPTGPWSAPQDVCTPSGQTASVFAYNAKAHPEQSDHRGLLVSYNVNSLDIYESLEVAATYRPRFIRVPWTVVQLMANAANQSLHCRLAISAA